MAPDLAPVQRRAELAADRAGKRGVACDGDRRAGRDLRGGGVEGRDVAVKDRRPVPVVGNGQGLRPAGQ